MRILQILPELNVGGVETGTVDFAKYLREHKHHSVVVSNGGALVSELEEAGIRHYQLPVHKKSIWTARESIKALRKIILDEKIDIVHARSRVPGWIAFFACRHTPANFITTCHGYYSKSFFSRIMGWGKFTIVPSEVIGQHMVEDFGVPVESIRRIPRSVDLKRFNVKAESKKGNPDLRVIIVGRLTPLKGHIYFLKAMAKVVRSMPFVKVWVVGDAPTGKEGFRESLETLTRRLGLADSVEFLGNRNDVPQLLAQADCLVLASIVPEAFGRVIIEGQAVGIPVVATKVGGVTDIIDHEENGLLVPPKDTDAMAQAVLRIFHDKVLAQKMVAKAKEKLLKFYTLEHMAGQTIKVYKELIESMNILVIKLSAIGDVVLITASLAALRKKFPKAHIACLVGRDARKVLQRCPDIDELLIVDPKEKGILSLLRQAKKLARYKFDKVIDFQNNRLSHALAFLSFPRESYGYKRKLGFLLTNSVKNAFGDLPPIAHQFQLLKSLGIEESPEYQLKLWPSKQDEEYIQELWESEWLNSRHKVVGINLAASEKWLTKNWPPEHVAQLADILAAKNVRLIVTGQEKDRILANQISRLTKTKPADFTGKTDIMQLAVLISRCNVYISPDSAPLHIAAAMQTPFIAFFGPTSSKRHLPPADRFVVFEKPMGCAPCYRQECRQKTHACLKEIHPEDVAKQVFRLLDSSE